MSSSPRTASARLTVDRLAVGRDQRRELASDAREGLVGQRKSLPPKWFYDARGSELFEQITRLPEYYQTRTETEILEATAGDLVAGGGFRELVEIGSGSSRKTRVILEAMGHRHGEVTYVPLDVSEEALLDASRDLLGDYPWLEIHGVVGDFERHLTDLPEGQHPRLFAFLGSTIGNLDPAAQVGFLEDVASLLSPEDALLLGADLVKEPAVLVAAYDDAAGITAEFNRNVLHVLNRELDGDLPVGAFRHVARWVPEHDRIEMHLRATRPVTATLRAIDLTVSFAEGEELLTEISSKFTRESLTLRGGEAGLRLRRWDPDGADRYALALLGT